MSYLCLHFNECHYIYANKHYVIYNFLNKKKLQNLKITEEKFCFSQKVKQHRKKRYINENDGGNNQNTITIQVKEKE